MIYYRQQIFPIKLTQPFVHVVYPWIFNFQLYDENFHMLKKGLPDEKCSLFLNMLMGNAVDSLPDFSPNTNGINFRELTQHAENVVIRSNQFKSFFDSCGANSVTRFEVVISRGLNFAEFFDSVVHGRTNIKDTPIWAIFQKLIQRLFQTGVIVSSTGNWWIDKRCQTLKKINLHLADITLNRLTEKPVTLNQLYLAYNIEQIVYYASFGSYNKFVDLRGRNWLLSPDIIQQFLLALENPAQLPIRDTVGIENIGTWFEKSRTSRFHYSPAMANHAEILIRLAPPDSHANSESAFPLPALLS